MPATRIDEAPYSHVPRTESKRIAVTPGASSASMQVAQSPPQHAVDTHGIMESLKKLPGGGFVALLLLAVIAGQQAYDRHDNAASTWLSGRLDTQEKEQSVLGEQVAAIRTRMDEQEKSTASIKIELELVRRVQQGTLEAIREQAEWEAEALEAGFAGKKLPKRPDTGKVYTLEGMLAQ